MPPPVEPIPGVPEGPPWAVLTDDGVELRGAVRFELGEATLSEESLPVLGDVRALLQAHPEIRRVRIDGHTDSLGSADFNLTLSRLRAQSVVDYLVSEGIDAGRVSAEGFGQEKPIDSNETAEGRARNRRVEVTIIERD